ncbi:hypothetical protein NWFMUON74_04140 [Nocardia wallacei]|uniref:Uncharacterized protein n=1 Tax=Nocardia wallacei TaxID=480035 RepID=A0A7G1KBW2_9NOCA|nr:hypothetical protein NWFMUON74_04140 [Nocardia wallacei]
MACALSGFASAACALSGLASAARALSRFTPAACAPPRFAARLDSGLTERGSEAEERRREESSHRGREPATPEAAPINAAGSP